VERIVQRDRHAVRPAAASGIMTTRVIDKDAAHSAGGHCKEVGAVLTDRILLASQLEIRLEGHPAPQGRGKGAVSP